MDTAAGWEITVEDLPPELELLLRAVRPVRDPADEAENAREMRRLAGRSPDWNLLRDLAARHHVMPLLVAGLKRAAWPAVPEEQKTVLIHAYSRNLKRNLRLAHHAAGVVRAFGEQGIRILPWKGVFLAQSVYGQLSSRELNDIDLLIGRADVPRGGQLLASMGFRPVETLDQEQVFRDLARQVEIDLHWQLTPVYFPVRFEFEELWQRSVPAELAGIAYRGLSAEDLLLVLCIQLAKDSWERLQRLEQLQKVCDIAFLVQRAPGLDWPSIGAAASARGLSRVLHLSLLLGVRLLGCKLPEPIAAAAWRDRRALSLARQVSSVQSLAATAPAPGRNSLLDLRLRLRQQLFYFRLRERQADKWRYLGRVLGALAGGARAAPSSQIGRDLIN